MADDNQAPMAASWISEINAARGEASKSRPKSRATANKVDAESNKEARQLAEIADKLTQPEYFAGLVRAPADIMLMKTGHPHWNLSNKEVETLSVTGSLTFKAFVQVDPRYMALILFLSNAFFIYGSRVIEEIKMMRQEELEKIEKRDVKP